MILIPVTLIALVVALARLELSRTPRSSFRSTAGRYHQ